MRKIIIGLLVAMMIMMVGCSTTETPSGDVVTTSTTEAGVTITAEPTEATPDETLTFVESKIVSVGSEEFVALVFDFTNNSGTTKSPDDAFNVAAFQNGIELNCTTFSDEPIEGAIDWFTRVQTGYTVKVAWFFRIGDDSPMSIEVSNGETFTVEVK